MAETEIAGECYRRIKRTDSNGVCGPGRVLEAVNIRHGFGPSAIGSGSTVKTFNPVANAEDALYQTGNDFAAAVRYKTDWENISREVQQLDRLISNADQSINQELNRIRDQVRAREFRPPS